MQAYTIDRNLYMYSSCYRQPTIVLSGKLNLGFVKVSAPTSLDVICSWVSFDVSLAHKINKWFKYSMNIETKLSI